jgi:hypothetical protein
MIHIDFRILISHAGSPDGARILFQRLIASLVRSKYRDAREIRPNPGDWGIDVLVGKITDRCFIWQAKYFIDGVEESQKKQIRESFTSLMEKSQEKKFKVDCWTLCLPCNLSPEESIWWDTWQKKMTKKYGVKIELLDETGLRADLESPDCAHIKLGYFGENPTIMHYFLQALNKIPERDVQELPEPSLYEDMLFIKKLKDGGVQEYFSAKTQFFNAELLTEEIIDNDIQTEIKALYSLREKIRSIWETRYNEENSRDPPNSLILISSVLKAIENQDKGSLSSPEIMASFVHKQGITHQLADKCQIGWTSDFRKKYQSYYQRVE